MNYDEIKNYLSILVDMEKNMYIQECMLRELSNKYARLGIKRDFRLPEQHQASADYMEEIGTVGIVIGVIVAIIVTIFNFGSMWNGSWGIFAIFGAPVVGVFWGLCAGGVFGLILGLIIATEKKKQYQKKLDDEYRFEIKEYQRQTKDDEKRVNNEILRKKFISQQLELLKEQYVNTKRNLEVLYDYNIIHDDYKYDIVAICSFYQYFDKKRTLSLGFDSKTGDKGAYNIYEEEKRLGIIISKLDDVLNKLDMVIENQRTIADTLNQANNTINYLNGNIQKMCNQINSVNASIENQTAIEAYNNERIQKELDYINTMNIIYKWH
ncbi:MAG: hypothetical protein IJZ34_13835 [Lachnospiraceae bacterium]|nr:hypothetical protein [Lachnospiraceae bacterium]